MLGVFQQSILWERSMAVTVDLVVAAQTLLICIVSLFLFMYLTP